MSDPLLWAIYLLIAVCVGSLAWSLRPTPQTVPAVRLPKPFIRRIEFFDSEQAEDAKKHGPIMRLLLSLGRFIPQSWNQWDQLRLSLSYTRSRLNIQAFLGVKIMAAGAMFFAASVLMFEFGRVHLLARVLFGVVGFAVPDFWLRTRVRRRQRAIIRLLRDPALTERMGLAGRERVARLYSMDQMIEQTEALLDRLLDAP